MLKRTAAATGVIAPRPRPWTERGLLLFAVALALRIAYAWAAIGLDAQPHYDSLEFDTVAWNLARGFGFALDSGGMHYPSATSPPLLPWITSLLYRAIGHQYFAAVILQCVIGAIAPLLLAAFGTAMFGSAVGRLAAWLAAIHPLLLFISGYLLTETLFITLLLAALALSVDWVKTPRPARAVGAGIAWGLCNLARPTALLLPLALFAWGWVPLGLSLAPRERMRQMAMLLLGMGLVIGPWTLRNAIVLHTFVPVAARSGGALLAGNNAVVWNDPVKRGGATDNLWVPEILGEYRRLTEPQLQALTHARALAFLRAHVADWPAMALAKLERFWRLTAEGGGTGIWQRPGSPLSPLLARIDPLLVWSAAILPFALWGLGVALGGPRRWFQSLGLWIIVYFMLITVVYFGSLRMRIPIEPLVVLFAAAGFDDVRRRLRTRARGMAVIRGGR
jgi:4-amino-4-deoxy-L-arabinose transferase-like glycosyltransferase